MNIDQAEDAFDRLYLGWVENKARIETEQDARFQVIDRMLTEVLGWPHEEIKTERHVDSGFVDYLLMVGGRGRFVVEAKRIDRILVDSKNPIYATYKASGAALQSARDGLDQAKRYCSDAAVPFAALTTGFEWIGFWALRTDGKPPIDGKALVFPTLEAIRNNFAKFYDLFSHDGILNNRYQIYVHEAEGLHVSHAEMLYRVLEPSEVRLLSKSKLAADLENVFRNFFGTMSGDDDPEMLARCFVESKESREADISLQKITRNLINRIDVVEPGEGSELSDHVRVAVENQRGEFVLIIGNKGAGKSTFIDRFFRMTLEKELRERCLVVRVNLQDSDGQLSSVVAWLRTRMIEEVERAFFGDKPPTFDELQGIFFSEYERWRDGEYRHLYESDKTEFKIKFGEFIADLIERNPEKYLNRLLRDAVRSRKFMPCLIFDNTDHFPQEFQEAVFQYAQSVHRANFSFVVCPITDRTIWQLHKHGPLQSYETTAFYLPIPSTKEVLEKRVAFLQEKLELEKGKERGDYFLAKGIRLRVDDLNAFAACIDEVFVQSDYVSRTVGWISNHDIRRSLNIAQRIITSPIVSMEELVKTYLADGRLTIPRLKIRQALIFGDHNQFRQEANDYVLNVFAVSADQLTTPLVRLSILRLLIDIEAQSSDPETRYLSVEAIRNYLEPCGISRHAVHAHLGELLKFRLIEPYDPTDSEVYEDQRVRVAHCGHIHLEMALRDDVYFSSMALTTAVRSISYVDEIRELKKHKMDRDGWRQVGRLFAEYLLREDEAFVSIPNLGSYEGQVLLRNELRSAWTGRSGGAQEEAVFN